MGIHINPGKTEELRSLFMQAVEGDSEALILVPQLMAEGADPTARDTVHRYCALDWAAANDYDSSLLAMAQALMKADHIAGQRKIEAIHGCTEYVESPNTRLHLYSLCEDIYKAPQPAPPRSIVPGWVKKYFY
jgi:hypothetical protein